MKIAVIGSGISGLGAAWLLREHEVTLFEAEPRLGGHARTREALGVAVDTGFIVCNARTYPLFLPLMAHLGIPLKPTDMSFSASLFGGKIEYGTRTLAALFAQPKRLFDPEHWRMLRDCLRFFKGASAYRNSDLSLGEMLAQMGLGAAFRDRYLLPMSGAIWSTPTEGMLDFPASAFVQFFENHGLLSVAQHPQWFTVEGGSARYVSALAEASGAQIRLNSPVIRVERGAQITVHTAAGAENFDRVVFATHAPQALALIDNPTADERAILGAFRTERNHVVLHSDRSFMPKAPRAWCAWNYVSKGAPLSGRPVSLSYWMNLLQGLKTPEPLIVTLNPERRPAQIHDETWLAHPQFDAASARAQALLPTIQGADRLYFAGAWTRYGFHEDGLLSALRAAQAMGVDWPLGPDPWGAA